MVHATRPRTLALLSAGVMIAGIIAASVPATASAIARPVTKHLAGGITVIRFPNGNTLTTAPMHFRKVGGVHADGFGQTNGDCGVSKLWTYASNHTYQLSLIGNPGVVLGDGWADTSTDGIGELPSFINFSPRGQTYTSGRVGIWPGLFASEAATVGSDATNEGDCLIAVAAPWN